MCKYLNNTDDWEKHLRTVEKLLPIFQKCESINYLRYANFYLEKMRQLPNEFPKIYNHFKNGEFVVKGKPGTFNAISLDMKLEQTVQRSNKTQGGIIGQTRQNNEWQNWNWFTTKYRRTVIYFIV